MKEAFIDHIPKLYNWIPVHVCTCCLSGQMYMYYNLYSFKSKNSLSLNVQYFFKLQSICCQHWQITNWRTSKYKQVIIKYTYWYILYFPLHCSLWTIIRSYLYLLIILNNLITINYFFSLKLLWILTASIALLFSKLISSLTWPFSLSSSFSSAFLSCCISIVCF